METLTLNARETACLLLLDDAVSDLIENGVSEDIMEELRELQPELDNILFGGFFAERKEAEA